MSSTLTTILAAQSLLTQHYYYYYYYADCYIMQTKYIENYYNKGGPDIGDKYIGSDSLESIINPPSEIDRLYKKKKV